MQPGQSPQREDVPQNLPQDVSMTHYVILKEYERRTRKSKDVAKYLSMDKKEVKKETNALVGNGYLSKKNNELTSKALNL